MKKPLKKMMMADRRVFAQLRYIVFVVLSLSFSLVNGQTADSVNRKRLKTIIATSAIGYTGSMIALSKIWYSDFDKQSFRFFNDSKEWNQLDKLGHSYFTFQIAAFGPRAFQWAGLPKKKSDKIAAISSFFVISSIELFDGRSSGYGASVSDLAANAIGASLYVGQQSLWNETRIIPKFSFHQTYFAPLRPDILGSNLGEEIIKDYNGQTYWLCTDVDKFTRFPKWLNIAVGYGAHSMLYASNDSNIQNGVEPFRQYYIGLDFDLSGIKTRSKLVKGLLYVANLVKLPAPTLEFSRGRVKAHAFYF
ncbi:MAG: DUF2279 domain-containing protein [Cyclobacteriaceae bacterium]|nr:DUF2279 domain-containing protein [Cyclobacteriaceae bacterium]